MRLLRREQVTAVEMLRPPDATRQEPPDRAVESREKHGDVGVSGRRQAVEDPALAGRGACLDTLEEQRVEMHVRFAAPPDR